MASSKSYSTRDCSERIIKYSPSVSEIHEKIINVHRTYWNDVKNRKRTADQVKELVNHDYTIFNDLLLIYLETVNNWLRHQAPIFQTLFIHEKYQKDLVCEPLAISKVLTSWGIVEVKVNKKGKYPILVFKDQAHYYYGFPRERLPIFKKN